MTNTFFVVVVVRLVYTPIEFVRGPPTSYLWNSKSGGMTSPLLRSHNNTVCPASLCQNSSSSREKKKGDSTQKGIIILMSIRYFDLGRNPFHVWLTIAQHTDSQFKQIMYKWSTYDKRCLNRTLFLKNVEKELSFVRAQDSALTNGWHGFYYWAVSRGTVNKPRKIKIKTLLLSDFHLFYFIFFNQRSSLVRDEMSLAISFQAGHTCTHTPNKRIAEEEASSAFLRVVPSSSIYRFLWR
jgi:hypothetical protein